MADETTKDIYASIEAAYDSAMGESQGELPPPESKNLKEPTPVEEQPAKTDGGDAGAEKKAESAPAAESEAEASEYAPHASLSAEEASAFRHLPKEAQGLVDTFIRRRHLAYERYVTKVQREARQQVETLAQPHQDVAKILEPHARRMRLGGKDLARELDSQLAWAQEIDENPLNAIAQLCQRTGVAPRQVYDYLNGAGKALASQGGQGSRDSHSDAQAERIEQLERQLQDLAAGVHTAEAHGMKAQVDAIGALADVNGNRLYPYFEDVRAEMAPIARRLHEQNPTWPLHQVIDTAYKKTVWAHDEIRPMLLQEEQQRRFAVSAEKKRVASSLPAGSNGVKNISRTPPSTIQESIVQAAEELGLDLNEL